MSIRSLVRKQKNLLGAALGFLIYAKPSRYWVGMHEYCLRGGRHDLIKVHSNGLRFPIYLRRGTSDIFNYHQLFVRKEYSFLPVKPINILDLGGYIGLASVYLANQFPDSKIVLIEPDPDNFAIALLNCRGYDNIKCLNYGVWSKSCKISLASQVGGDWGNMFEEVLSIQGDEELDGIDAKSVKELMDMANFEQIDFLKIDIEGAEKVLFDVPESLDWLERCKIISIELHDRMLPGCSESVYKAMATLQFSFHKHGEFDYFIASR